MSEQMIHLPILTVTNLVLIWKILHGWEDPGWGQSSIDQITITLAIHDLATKIADQDIRKQIQSVAAQATSKMAEGLVRESA